MKEFGPWEINFDMDALLPAGVPEKEEVKDKSEEDIYYQDVLNKYKPYIESFHYSEQLANYINTGYLEQEKLEQEIIELVEELKKKEDSEETKTLKAIQNWQNTEKEKFSKLLANTLGKVESGTLTMGAYLHILGELLKIEFYQIEDFKVDNEVIEQFKKGIDKSRTLHKSDNSFEIRLSRWVEKEDSPAKNKFNDIRDYLIEANQSCGLEEKSSIKDQILEFIKNNDSEKLTSFHKEMGYIGEPFLADASPEIFFGNIEKSDRTTQEAFNYFLRDRYYNIEDMIMKEQPFLEGLQIQIEDYFKEIPKKKINHIRLLELKATIEFFLKKLDH